MASIDEDLGSIERDIRTLKIEYEQYFGGGRSRPPTDTQWRLEVMLKKYSDRAAEFTSGQRFRYSNLTQTYAKYHDMWGKKNGKKKTETCGARNWYRKRPERRRTTMERRPRPSKRSGPARPLLRNRRSSRKRRRRALRTTP